MKMVERKQPLVVGGKEWAHQKIEKVGTGLSFVFCVMLRQKDWALDHEQLDQY